MRVGKTALECVIIINTDRRETIKETENMNKGGGQGNTDFKIMPKIDWRKVKMLIRMKRVVNRMKIFGENGISNGRIKKRCRILIS